MLLNKEIETPFSRSSPLNHLMAILNMGRAFLLAAAFVLALGSICLAEGFLDRESQIKIAYLYHFSRFIEWPSSLRVFNYCVYRDKDFARQLQDSYRNKTIAKASIEVRNINERTEIDDCQLIYFAKNAPKDYLKKISSLAILSVGTQANFTKLGGIIYLFEDDERVRFFVDNNTATKAGLKISSQLLKLSKKP